MGISDLVERLIVEHGSSIILREHLSFLRDQGLVLEAKVKALEVERDNLKSERERLVTEIERFKKEAKIREEEDAQQQRPARADYKYNELELGREDD